MKRIKKDKNQDSAALFFNCNNNIRKRMKIPKRNQEKQKAKNFTEAYQFFFSKLKVLTYYCIFAGLCLNDFVAKDTKKQLKSCRNSISQENDLKTQTFIANLDQKKIYDQGVKNKYKRTSLISLGQNSNDQYKASLKTLELIQNKSFIARNNQLFKSNSNSNTFWGESEVNRAHTNHLSTKYDPINGAVIKESLIPNKFGKIDSLSNYRDKTRKYSPNYSEEYRTCLANDSKAFNRVKGEFSYVYDISNNHKFISTPFK